MSGIIQFICLLFSFFFGFFLYSFFRFNYKLFRKKKLFVFIFGESLVVLLSSLVYVYFLYRINYGVLHIYFVMMILFGYFVHSVKKCK